MEQKSVIEVTVLTDKVLTLQPILQACLERTQDKVIGYEVYDDLTLFVVQLDNFENANEHLEVLMPAFRQGLINAFEYNSCFPIRITFRSDYHAAMKRFPLRYGESWIPAPEAKNVVCICLKKPCLDEQQMAWQQMVENGVTLVETC